MVLTFPIKKIEFVSDHSHPYLGTKLPKNGLLLNKANPVFFKEGCCIFRSRRTLLWKAALGHDHGFRYSSTSSKLRKWKPFLYLFKTSSEVVTEMARVVRPRGITAISTHATDCWWETSEAAFRATPKRCKLGSLVEYRSIVVNPEKAMKEPQTSKNHLHTLAKNLKSPTKIKKS
jgi:hypothetical protein